MLNHEKFASIVCGQEEGGETEAGNASDSDRRDSPSTRVRLFSNRFTILRFFRRA